MATQSPWKSWQKISFRFFFLFFSITSFTGIELITLLTSFAFTKKGFQMTTPYKPLAGVLHWLDMHIYHIGYHPKIHDSFPGDNHFGIVFYITAFFVVVLATVTWSILDKKRGSYNKLFYWFCLYLRYLLAIIIISYGIDKLIPVQMSHPDVVMLTTPYGELNRFNVLWSFMGMSPGYMMFTGAIELIGGLLLFFPRTAVAGYLLVIAVLSNVVALNWFYNVPVKVFSALLLLYALFLLAPYFNSLFQFFFRNNAAPYPQRRFVFQTKWKKYLVSAVLLLVPLLTILLSSFDTYKRYGRQENDARKEKIYDVTAFIARDTLPPLLTDTLRWKRVFLSVYGDQFVIANMKNNMDWYQFETDSIKKTFTLHDNPNKATWKVFHYTNPAKDRLQLTGKWKGKDISISLKLSPVDSIPLNKEGIKFIQEGMGD
jgi:hypothetical protein